MTNQNDPSIALQMFQDSLDRLSLQPGATDPELFMYLDQPEGRTRMSFARLQDRTVITLVMFIEAQASGGAPRFLVFYAVREAYRNQGRAKRTLAAAIREMEHGCALTGVDALLLEAVVGPDNIAAQRVAAQVFAREPVAITDPATGLPALAYARTFGQGAALRA